MAGSEVTMDGWHDDGGNYFLYHKEELWGITNDNTLDWEQRETADWEDSDPSAVAHGICRFMVRPDRFDLKILQQKQQTIQMIAVWMCQNHQIQRSNFLSPKQRRKNAGADIKSAVVAEAPTVDQHRKTTRQFKHAGTALSHIHSRYNYLPTTESFMTPVPNIDPDKQHHHPNHKRRRQTVLLSNKADLLDELRR